LGVGQVTLGATLQQRHYQKAVAPNCVRDPSCPVHAIDGFPHLRNGSIGAWVRRLMLANSPLHSGDVLGSRLRLACVRGTT